MRARGCVHPAADAADAAVSVAACAVASALSHRSVRDASLARRLSTSPAATGRYRRNLAPERAKQE
jgi:hypothetical protein